MGTGLRLGFNQEPKKDIYEYNIATNSWVQKQNLPVQRASAISFSINGKGYIGTGNIASQQGSHISSVEVLSDFYQYDPATDGWASKTAVEPSGRYGAVGFVVNGKGYVAFGSRGQMGPLASATAPLNSIREYDPIADTWVDKANAVEGFLFSQAFVLNNKAYIAGGVRIVPNQIRESVSNTMEFNPATNTWTAKANLPPIANSTVLLTDNSRANGISFGLLDRGYLISGKIWKGANCVIGFGAFSDGACIHRNILKYNPYLNTWTEVSNTNPFDANQGIELAAFSQDDCGFGYATAGRTSNGANFAHFKFNEAPDANYISGSGSVCFAGNTFTLHLSTPGTVTWTHSSNVSIVSGQGTKSVIIKANTGASGNGFIQASINLGCRVVTFPQKTFWAGNPTTMPEITTVTYDGMLTPTVCSDLYQTFTIGQHSLTALSSGTTTFPVFTLNSSTGFVTGSSSGNSFNFNAKRDDINFSISYRITEKCASVEKCTYFSNSGPIFSIVIYPNPAEEEVTIQLGKEGETKSIALYNESQVKVFSAETSDREIVVQTASFPEGDYVVNIAIGDKTYSRHLQIKH